jgi:iodothyronine deiodinase-like protein
MRARYDGLADFYAVYIREAHPLDGWRMASNDRAGIQVKQPRTIAERLGVAERCSGALQMTMPLLIDGLDNRVAESYSAFPDRLYLIDRDGNVAYKGGRGPFGFEPRDLETELVLAILEGRKQRL